MTSRTKNPPHYTQGPVHCIDAMISAFGVDAVGTFCLINAFKYTWRSTTHERGVVENVQKGMYYMKKASELKQLSAALDHLNTIKTQHSSRVST